MRAEARARLFGGAPEPVCVARFALLRRIGEGSSGIVYAAHDPQLDREVALKLLTVDGDAESVLLAEARALARLAHPNVLPVFDAGLAEGIPWIVSELVDGGTLREWAATTRPPQEKVRVLVQAGRGLAAGHARGLTHRDVKPENVLVGSDGRPRVADFGLASLADQAVGTPQGRPLPGTVRYMAPEQLAGERADALSDQFGFCVMGWELLTGQLPFLGDTAHALLEAMRAQRVEASRAPGVGSALAVFRRGLSFDPGARFPDMTALCDALEPRRSRWPLVAGVTAAACAIGAGGVLAFASSGPPAPSPGPSNSSLESAVPGPPESAETSASEKEIAITASRLAQQGKPDECSRFLSTRADTDGLALLWLGCSRLASDPAELERACTAWRSKPRPDPGSPVVDECEPALLQAKALLKAGDYRGCAEKVLAARPSPIGSITLAACVRQANEKDLFRRQCHYQFKLPGSNPGEESRCDAQW